MVGHGGNLGEDLRDGGAIRNHRAQQHAARLRRRGLRLARAPRRVRASHPPVGAGHRARALGRHPRGGTHHGQRAGRPGPVPLGCGPPRLRGGSQVRGRAGGRTVLPLDPRAPLRAGRSRGDAIHGSHRVRPAVRHGRCGSCAPGWRAPGWSGCWPTATRPCGTIWLPMRATAHGPRLRVAVTGATGLLGTALIPFLTTGGHEVIAVSRRRGLRDAIHWDPAAGAIDHAGLEGLDAVVHLAGETVGTRWSDHRKRRIRDSRVEGTMLLAEALAGLRRPPRVLVSASAMGIYGDRGDEVLTEDALPEGPPARLLRRARARLGERRRSRPRRRHPGGESAVRPGAHSGRRRARADAAALPPRRGWPARRRESVGELDLDRRRDRRDPPRALHRRARRAGEHRRAGAGHQPQLRGDAGTGAASGPPCCRPRRRRSSSSSARWPTRRSCPASACPPPGCSARATPSGIRRWRSPCGMSWARRRAGWFPGSFRP